MSDGAHSSISSFDNADQHGAVPSPSFLGASSASNSVSSEAQNSAARDARIARFYNLDAKRTEGVRAVDILPQLQRCLAFLAGGRDRRGGPVLVIPPPPTCPKSTSAGQLDYLQEEYKIVLDYLASIPSQQSRDTGFSIILDLRGSSWANAKPLLNVLQENFVFPVHTLYVIKPDRFWEKQKAQIAVSKIPFETVVIGCDSLARYIDADQLPIDLKGTQSYNHGAWIELRMHIEDFLSRALNLLDRLDDLHRVIQSSPQDNTSSNGSTTGSQLDMQVSGLQAVLQSKKALDEHCALKPLVARAPVELVERNGRDLLESICAYANAQDPDALSDLTNPDLRSLLPLVSELISRLHSKRQQTQQVWYLKRQKLEQAYQLRVFEQDCEKLLAWLHQTSADLLTVYSRIGQSRQEADELRHQHEEVSRVCREFETNFARVRQVAHQLAAGNSAATQTVRRAAGRLEAEWRNFSAALDERAQILILSVEFYAHLEAFRSRLPMWHASIDNFVRSASIHMNGSSNGAADVSGYLNGYGSAKALNGTSTESMRADIEKLESLKAEFSHAYSELANDGRKLLTTIQTPPAPPEDNGEFDGLPPIDPQFSIMHRADFTQAASLIMDLAHENLQQFRVLESTVNRIKSHIERELRVKNFHRDVHLVLAWLSEHGETFLRQNRRFGQSWPESKQLLNVHENFEACAKNAIENSDKLLKYADQLVHRSICSEAELDAAKGTLQSRVQSFIGALETRHDLLNVAMAFYLHADEVANWLDKLEPELASDDVNAMGGSSEIEEVIFEYQQQRVSTLEAIQRTIDEGNDVLKLYTRDLATLPPIGDVGIENSSIVEADVERSKSVLSKVAILCDEYKARWDVRIQKLTLAFQVLLLEDDIRDLILGFDEMSRALFTSASGGPILGPTSLAMSNQSIEGASKQLAVVVEKVVELKEARQKITLIANELRKLIETAGFVEKLRIRSSSSYGSSAHANTRSASTSSLAESPESTGLVLARSYIDSLLLAASQAEAVADENVQRRRRDIEQMGQLVKLEGEHAHALFLLRNAEGMLGSSESVFSNSCPRDKAEADRITTELDSFFQKTMEPAMVAANGVVESIQLLVDSGCDLPILHQKSEQIVDKWEQLLSKWKDRRKVSSLASQWYETVERVFLVLESLIQEYRNTGDVCQSLVAAQPPAVGDQQQQQQQQTPRAQLLEGAKEKHIRQKEEFLQACTLARRRAAAFLKHLDHYAAQHYYYGQTSAAQSLVVGGRTGGSPEAAVRDKLSRLLALEESVLNCWCEKQSLLEQCLQYALFEASATEVISRVTDTSTRFKGFLSAVRANTPPLVATCPPDLKKDADEILSTTRKLKEHADSLIGVGKRLVSSSTASIDHLGGVGAKLGHGGRSGTLGAMSGVSSAAHRGHLHAGDIASWITRINTELSVAIDPLQKAAARVLSIALTSADEASSPSYTDDSLPHLEPSLLSSQPSDLSSLDSACLSKAPSSELVANAEKAKKLSRRKDFIVSELIQTERAYIKNLETCLKVFLSVFTSPTEQTRPVPPYLAGKENVIFGNIADIYDFHHSVFLKHLEVYEDVPEDMGHVFVTFADRFNVLYVQYCKNKPESDQLLLQYGSSFLDELQISAGMLDPIGSYLIKPVQRITKYQLLLKDLLTCCDDVNGEIKEALDVMTNVPKKANDAIHFSMLVGMPANLNEQTLGELHLQDVFTVWSGKQILAIRKGRDRHVFLFDTCVIFSKETRDMTLPNNGKMRYLFKTSLPLRELNVMENLEGSSSSNNASSNNNSASGGGGESSSASGDCRFALCADDVRIVLKASRPDVKALWVRKVREVMREPDRFLQTLPDTRLAEQLQRSRLTAMKHAISRHNLMQIASAVTAPDNDDAGSQTDPTNSAGDTSSIDERNPECAYLLTDITVPVVDGMDGVSSNGSSANGVVLSKGQQVEVVDWQPEMSVIRVQLQEFFIPTCQLSRAKSIGSLSGSVEAPAGDGSGGPLPNSPPGSYVAGSRMALTSAVMENGTLKVKVKEETTVASLKRWFSGKKRIKHPSSPCPLPSNAAAQNARRTPLDQPFNKAVHGVAHASSNNSRSPSVRRSIDANSSANASRKGSTSSRIITIMENSDPSQHSVSKTLALTSQLLTTTSTDPHHHYGVESLRGNSIGNETRNGSSSNSNSVSSAIATATAFLPPPPDPLSLTNMELALDAVTADNATNGADQQLPSPELKQIQRTPLAGSVSVDMKKGSTSDAGDAVVGTRTESATSVTSSTTAEPGQNQDAASGVGATADGSASTASGAAAASSQVSPEDAKKEQAMFKRRYIIQELVDTERDYVKDLGLIVTDYKTTVTAGPLPEDLHGKEKVVFGNIEQIYEWHRDTFLPEVEKCVDLAASNPNKDVGVLIANVFNRFERRLYMYVKYCENKPKADFLVADCIDYFEELRVKFGHKLNVADLLIKPVQRIMKYQLLMKDILKQSERAGVDSADIRRAVDVMHVVPKACDDMMFVGRLSGFNQSITAQGKLLLQDRLLVQEPDSDRPRERQVFLFEQIVIVSEAFERKAKVTIPGLSNADFVFKAAVKVNRMSLNSDDSDPTRFFISDRSVTPEVRYVVQTPTAESAVSWTSQIRAILKLQDDFSRIIQNPKLYEHGKMVKPTEENGPAARAYQAAQAATTTPATHTELSAGKNRSVSVEVSSSSLTHMSKQKSNPGDAASNGASGNSAQVSPPSSDGKEKKEKKKKGLLENLNKINPFKSSSKKREEKNAALLNASSPPPHGPSVDCSSPDQQSNNSSFTCSPSPNATGKPGFLSGDERSPIFVDPPSNVTVRCGETAVLTCKIQANPRASVCWHFGCADANNNGSLCSETHLPASCSSSPLTPEGVATLIISGANAAQHAGVYACHASNAAGVATARCLLTVLAGS